MTRSEARRRGLPPGYAVRLEAHEGLKVYLADYRRAEMMTTTYPGSAEYVERLIDADELARRVSHYTGQPWVVTTVPTDNAENRWSPLPGEEVALDTEAGEYHWPEDERVRLSDGRVLPVTIDELALSNAIEDAAAGIDDDEADLITAAAGFHLPCGVPRFGFDGVL